MLNWKIVLGSALFAVLISFVAGLAGGNPFGVVLLRMLVSGALIGGLAAGAQLIIRRFLPELGERLQEGGEGGSGQVDIVIDGDIEEEPVPAGVELEPAEPGPGDFQEDASPLEEVPAGEESGAESVGLHAESIEEPGDLEEVEEGEPVAEFTPLDTLPEMEHFSFEEVGGGSPAPAPGADLGREQLDAVKSRQDPETLAKAVRTFMKRDQEG